MMLCSVCGRSYEAGTLFCPADGTPLAADAVGPPPSASSELDRLLADPPPPAAPAYAPSYVPATPLPDPPARNGGLIAVVALLGVLVVGMLGYVMWQQQRASAAATGRAEQAERHAAEVQREAEAARRGEEERASAERQARDAERMPSASASAGTTVWANSPNDGFLALRSSPGISRGSRLLKIPHGQPLTLGDCNSPTTSPGGRYGSWCRATYSGTAGWVFDAFVTR